MKLNFIRSLTCRSIPFTYFIMKFDIIRKKYSIFLSRLCTRKIIHILMMIFFSIDFFSIKLLFQRFVLKKDSNFMLNEKLCVNKDAKSIDLMDFSE